MPDDVRCLDQMPKEATDVWSRVRRSHHRCSMSIPGARSLYEAQLRASRKVTANGIDPENPFYPITLFTLADITG